MAAFACAIEQELQGQLVVNVIGFQLQDSLGAETAADAATVANQVAIAWKNRIIPRQSSAVRFLQVVARGARDAGVVGVSVAAPQSGGVAAQGLPGFAAVRVVLQSATPRRAGRGRTGISGVPEGDTLIDTPNNLSPTAQPLWATALNNFVSDLAAIVPTITPVVISRELNLVPRPTPLISPVTSVSVSVPLGTRVSRIR